MKRRLKAGKVKQHTDPKALASASHATWDPTRSTEDVRSQASLEEEGTLSESVVAAMGTNKGRATGTKPVKSNNRRSEAGKKNRNKPKSKKRACAPVSPRQGVAKSRGPSKKTGLQQQRTRQHITTGHMLSSYIFNMRSIKLLKPPTKAE